MVPIENPVDVPDFHATLYRALGIPADHAYLTESRPFYVTKDGKGRPVDALLERSDWSHVGAASSHPFGKLVLPRGAF